MTAIASRTLLVCVAALALVAGAHAQCSSSISCEACIEQGDCGWCDGACVEGTGTGSNNGECTSTAGTWSWGTCLSGTCSDNANCDTCTEAEGCGWCENSCVAGTSTGSTNGDCTSLSDNWYWTDGSCPATGCADYTSCSSCTGEDGCGWCDSSCVSGTSSGSNNGVCSSSSGNWDWGACGVECDQNVDCSSCTETSGCGWCSATGTCMAGSYSGPSISTCDGSDDQDGGWEYDTCPQCDLYMDCGDCTQQGGCGWCLSSGSCLAGGPGGSSDGSCSDDITGQWSWSGDYCCSQYTNCGDCTSADYCGWCGGQDSCINGNEFGTNTDNTCFEDWTYYGETCDTAWTPGGVGFVLCYIVLPILCFIVCVRGCVYMCYRRRRTRYVPLAAAPAANVTVVATNVGPGGYQQSGAYQQQLPPQQVPYGAASSAPYYANNNPPAYQGGYQSGGAGPVPPTAPATYYAQPVGGYNPPEKNELPPA